MTHATLNVSTDRMTAYEAHAAKLEDNRPHPSEAALEQGGLACMNELLDLILDTGLEDHTKIIAEALIGAFHSASIRIEREADRARDDLARAHRDFDGSEVADNDMQELTRKAYSLDVAVMAIEIMRNSASETYTSGTGEVWTPWAGSVKQTRVTAATMDARDALRSMKARRNAATDAGDQVVMFRGSPLAKFELDATRIFDALNWAKSQYPDMTLTTTGAPGAEQLAIKWAKQKGVRVVLAKPDFAKYARAAPFRANDEMLALEPVLCLTLETSLEELEQDGEEYIQAPFGPAANLGQKAEAAAIRHVKIAVKA